MKKISLILLSLVVIASACSKSSTSSEPATPKSTAPAALSAKFSVALNINNDGVKEGEDVKFDNQSANAVSYKWDFGNGFTSTEANPVFQFGCGTITVNLTVTGANGATATYSKDLLVYCKGKNAGGKNQDGREHTGITGE